jgi:hypothetical protein
MDFRLPREPTHFPQMLVSHVFDMGSNVEKVPVLEAQ